MNVWQSLKREIKPRQIFKSYDKRIESTLQRKYGYVVSPDRKAWMKREQAIQDK